MIKKSYIEKYFKTIKKQTDLNLKEQLNWGFYFSHNKKELLVRALDSSFFNTYDFTEVVCCNNSYYLQITKNEIHTKESLFERCKELYIFSKNLGINSFEGFDVEKI